MSAPTARRIRALGGHLVLGGLGVLCAIPVLLLYLVLQRRVVDGFVRSGLR